VLAAVVAGVRERSALLQLSVELLHLRDLRGGIALEADDAAHVPVGPGLLERLAEEVAALTDERVDLAEVELSEVLGEGVTVAFIGCTSGAWEWSSRPLSSAFGGVTRTPGPGGRRRCLG
jgi:hypothetical protein